MASPAAVVLDTWPVIEHLQGREPAAAIMQEMLNASDLRPLMSVVNYSEVCYTVANHAGLATARDTAILLPRLVTIEPLNAQVAQTAAWIKHTYQISLGDTFAAATALHQQSPVWTGDPELLCSDRIWEVRVLRPWDQQRPSGPRRRPGYGSMSIEEMTGLLTSHLPA